MQFFSTLLQLYPENFITEVFRVLFGRLVSKTRGFSPCLTFNAVTHKFLSETS